MDTTSTSPQQGTPPLTWTPRVPLYDRLSATGGPRHDRGGPHEPPRHLSRDAEDVLVRARRQPHLTLTELYRAVGLSGSKGTSSKRELIRAGLAKTQAGARLPLPGGGCSV